MGRFNTQTGQPTRYIRSSSAALAATPQTGGVLHVRGGPASTFGALKAGDWFEVNGELKQATADLNFDASGIGTIEFRPQLWRSPADGDGVIIKDPMGTFLLAANASWDTKIGAYMDADLTLEEIAV